MNLEKDFTAIYTTYAPKVLRICLGYASGNENQAKEWLQETFVRVWNYRKSFKEKSSVSTWIYRIAVNVCLSDLRKSRKQHQINESILVMEVEDETAINMDKRQDNINKMYHCINQLSEQNKALIMLELENVPQATIADTMGLEHGAVRTRLSRIRKTLLNCITNGKR